MAANLVEQVADRARDAYASIRAAHPDEQLYVFALYAKTDDALVALANSEQCAGRSERARWDWRKFAYRVELGAFRGGDVYDAAREALRALDDAGVFGTGKPRKRIGLLALAPDQSHSELGLVVSILNPWPLYRTFDRLFPSDKPVGRARRLGTAAYSLDELALSHDGKYLAALGWFGGAGAFVWRVRGGKTVLRNASWRELRDIAIDATGSLVFGIDETTLRRLAVDPARASGLELPAIPLRYGRADRFCASRDGTRAAVLSGRGAKAALELFDVAAGTRLAIREACLAPLAFTDDGKTLAAATELPPRLVLADARTLKTRTTHALATPIEAFAFAPDGKSYAVGDAGERGFVRVRSVTGKDVVAWRCHRYVRADALAFSPDGKHLAVAYNDGWLRCYDVNRKTLVLEARGRHEAMNACVFLDARTIAVGGRDVSRGGSPVLLFTVP